VDPSPPASDAENKAALRRQHRRLRREHVAALPERMRALLFLRPPVQVARAIPDGATVGLYHPHPHEAPTLSYARWLYENGRRVALPWFAERDAPMEFRRWADPFDLEALEAGPFGIPQPSSDAPVAEPSVLFVPLIAFTAEGGRLGQGGGHYDRWLAAHPETVAIGLGWDCQLAETLPTEAHDRPLDAIVTPTRLFEGNP